MEHRKSNTGKATQEGEHKVENTGSGTQKKQHKKGNTGGGTQEGEHRIGNTGRGTLGQKDCKKLSILSLLAKIIGEREKMYPQ